MSVKTLSHHVKFFHFYKFIEISDSESKVKWTSVSLGFIFWMWMWIPGMHTFGVRAIVAWSFDRVAPEAWGEALVQLAGSLSRTKNGRQP